MPGIILPPSWGAYKCVLCDSGVFMFFRKDPPQTERKEGVTRIYDQNVAARAVTNKTKVV